MNNQNRITIIDAEVLAVSGGVDDATDQPVVVLTLRPVTDSGWGCVNYSLPTGNARSLLDRLGRLLNTAEFDGRAEGVPP